MIGGMTRHMLPQLSGVPHLHVNKPFRRLTVVVPGNRHLSVPLLSPPLILLSVIRPLSSPTTLVLGHPKVATDRENLRTFFFSLYLLAKL